MRWLTKKAYQESSFESAEEKRVKNDKKTIKNGPQNRDLSW